MTRRLLNHWKSYKVFEIYFDLKGKPEPRYTYVKNCISYIGIDTDSK